MQDAHTHSAHMHAWAGQACLNIGRQAACFVSGISILRRNHTGMTSSCTATAHPSKWRCSLHAGAASLCELPIGSQKAHLGRQPLATARSSARVGNAAPTCTIFLVHIHLLHHHNLNHGQPPIFLLTHVILVGVTCGSSILCIYTVQCGMQQWGQTGT